MSTDTLTRPTSPISPTDEEEIHLTCCDPNLSLCGIDLTDDVEYEDVPDERLCVVCLVIDDSDLPCGAQGCGDGRAAS